MDFNRCEIEQSEFIFSEIRNIIPEEEYLLPSEWAEQKRILTKEFTSAPGRLTFDKSPYLREPLDCLSPDSPVREVVFQKGSQLGFTQMIIENFIGYTIDVYPRSILYVSADKELAEMNMTTRIDALISTANLQGKIRPSVTKKANKKTGDTKKMKEFAGGILYAFGANNANKARQFNAAVGLFDEIDGWPLDASGQGDPVTLFTKRTDAFSKNRKLVYISTPVDAETSRVNSLFKKGDQRYYYVPCPHCGEMQVLKWGAEEPEGPGLKFEKDEDGMLIRDSIHYQCVNSCKINMFEKFEMLKKGEWRATAKPKKHALRSYHLSALYSNFFGWDELIGDWIKAGTDKKKLKAFVNNNLGECWVEDVRTIKDEELMKNVRPYTSGTIPNKLAEKDGNGKIAVLTASVDINGSAENVNGWMAIEIKGHCRNGQTYSISKGELHGNTESGGNAWHALRDLLLQRWVADDGIEYEIGAAAIDSGFKAKAVYWFCAQHRRFFAVKGRSTQSRNDKAVSKSKTASGENLWSIDTIFYKNQIADDAMLSWAGNPIEQPQSFMNFPNDKRFGGLEDVDFEKKWGVQIAGNGYDKAFFKNFSAEHPIIKKNDDDDAGSVIGWKKRHSRAYNHFWDCTVYNLAIIDIMCKSISDNSKDDRIKKANTYLLMSYIADVVDETGKSFAT